MEKVHGTEQRQRRERRILRESRTGDEAYGEHDGTIIFLSPATDLHESLFGPCLFGQLRCGKEEARHRLGLQR